MNKQTKWLFIIVVSIIIIISILNSSFIIISAAFYRGSIITNIESEVLSSEEIAEIEEEMSSTGAEAILHLVLTVLTMVLLILFLTFLLRRFTPKIIGCIGIVISFLALVQIIIMLDAIIFLVLSLPNLIFGLFLIFFGFIMLNRMEVKDNLNNGNNYYNVIK